MASIRIPDLSFLDKENHDSNIKKRNYDNVSPLGMLTAFFTIIVIFLLISINNFWIFIGFFILFSLLSVFNSIKNKKSIYLPVFIIIISLLIIIWQYYNKIFSFFKKKENFYTLFRPYQPYPNSKNFFINKNNLLNDKSKPIKDDYQIYNNSILSPQISMLNI